MLKTAVLTIFLLSNIAFFIENTQKCTQTIVKNYKKTKPVPEKTKKEKEPLIKERKDVPNDPLFGINETKTA